MDKKLMGKKLFSKIRDLHKVGTLDSGLDQLFIGFYRARCERALLTVFRSLSAEKGLISQFLTLSD